MRSRPAPGDGAELVSEARGRNELGWGVGPVRSVRYEVSELARK